VKLKRWPRMVTISKLTKQETFLIVRALERLMENAPSQNVKEMVGKVHEKVVIVYNKSRALN
jgi:hypothetical protein